MSKFLLDSTAPEYRPSVDRGDLDKPRPTERRVTIGAKPSLTDYESIRLALETLVDKLKIQGRNEQNQLCITYLVPSQAEDAYAHALNILLRTPPVTKL